MGCGSSKRRVRPAEPGTSRHSQVQTCVQCGLDGHRKVATWWCEDCQHYICNYCAWNHSNLENTRNHYLLQACSLPKPKPTKPAWENKSTSKQAVLDVYFDTRADLHYTDVHSYNKWNQSDGEEHVREECLLPVARGPCCRKRFVTQAAAIVTACTFVPGGYIAVTDYLNEQVKLFTAKFQCNSYITLEGCKPTDICSHGSDVFVTIEDKTKIESLKVTLPYLGFGRKLKRKRTFKTEGYCDSIAVCRRSFFTYGLVAGVTYPQGFVTKKYQVHIMDFHGAVQLRLFYDDTGQTLFHGKVFVSGTPKQGEIIVSDKTDGSVQGFNTITGDGTFKHKVREPLGLSVDANNNIYVITNSCFFWIPPNRETVISFLKRGHRSKSSNCCYDNKTKTLAVTSNHSETVQLYKII